MFTGSFRHCFLVAVLHWSKLVAGTLRSRSFTCLVVGFRVPGISHIPGKCRNVCIRQGPHHQDKVWGNAWCMQLFQPHKSVISENSIKAHCQINCSSKLLARMTLHWMLSERGPCQPAASQDLQLTYGIQPNSSWYLTIITCQHVRAISKKKSYPNS